MESLRETMMLETLGELVSVAEKIAGRKLSSDEFEKLFEVFGESYCRGFENGIRKKINPASELDPLKELYLEKHSAFTK